MPKTALALLVAVAALALAPGASAVTTVTYSSSTGLRLEGDAGGDLTAVQAEESRFLVNGGVPGAVVPGSGCDQHNSIEVRCAYGANRFVTANLGDGDDEFRSNNLQSVAPSDTVVTAGGGNDTLIGGRGLDSYDGGPGNDIFNSFGTIAFGFDTNNDVFTGGDGNDRFFGDHGGTDTLRGGLGSDRLVAHP